MYFRGEVSVAPNEPFCNVFKQESSFPLPALCFKQFQNLCTPLLKKSSRHMYQKPEVSPAFLQCGNKQNCNYKFSRVESHFLDLFFSRPEFAPSSEDSSATAAPQRFSLNLGQTCFHQRSRSCFQVIILSLLNSSILPSF